MGRRKEREQAFILIYESMFSSDTADNEIIFSENVEPLGEYARALYEGVQLKKDELDDTISEYLNGWKLSRVSRINHSILLLAVYEIKYVEDVPVSVTINEAVELAKTYSEKKDASFINGVLGSLVRGND